jgi:antitoxin (DNA-binding transcriptional repressor) of toxin-antitoxin stability system
VCTRGVHIARSLSIVEARKVLGAVAEGVRRGGEPVVLTRRGRAVAKIVAATTTEEPRFDALGALRGSLTIRATFSEMQESIRELRAAFSESIERRAAGRTTPKRRKRA